MQVVWGNPVAKVESLLLRHFLNDSFGEIRKDGFVSFAVPHKRLLSICATGLPGNRIATIPFSDCLHSTNQ